MVSGQKWEALISRSVDVHLEYEIGEIRAIDVSLISD